MKSIVLLLAMGCIAMISGCASIVSKSQYPVTITTNAPDANIYVRNADSGLIIQEGKNPLMVTLPASKAFLTPATYQCEVKLKDTKQYRAISANIDPWFMGNFFFGGLIGLAIDGASGAAFKLDDSYYIHFSEYDK